MQFFCAAAEVFANISSVVVQLFFIGPSDPLSSIVAREIKEKTNLIENVVEADPVEDDDSHDIAEDPY